MNSQRWIVKCYLVHYTSMYNLQEFYPKRETWSKYLKAKNVFIKYDEYLKKIEKLRFEIIRSLRRELDRTGILKI